MGGLNDYGELKNPHVNLTPVEAANPRFICPACGETATVKNGLYCQGCTAFVHKQCCKLMAWSTNTHWDFHCPICRSELGRARSKSFWERVDDIAESLP